MTTLNPFTPSGATVNLAVTGASDRVALTRAPASFPELTAIVMNAGPATVFVTFGDATVAAVTATSHPILPGISEVFSVPNSAAPYLAAISGTGTATIYVTSGTGLPYGYGVGGQGTGPAAGTNVNVLSLIPGTGATNLGKAEDAAHTSGDVGVMSLGVVTDGATALAAAGDYSVLGVDTAGNQRMVGPVASGAASVGGPVRVGSLARTARLLVSNSQAVDNIATLAGIPVFRFNGIPEMEWQYAAASGGIVDTADNVLVAAGAAGIRNYLNRLDVLNTDATVGTEVVIKDGSTVIWRQFFPPSLAAVSQLMPTAFTFLTPLKGTAATALNVACITTSGQVYVNAGGYQAP